MRPCYNSPAFSCCGALVHYRQCSATLFSACGPFWNPQAERIMDPFDKERFLPADLMITLAINIVIAVLGYYLVVLWGLFGG